MNSDHHSSLANIFWDTNINSKDLKNSLLELSIQAQRAIYLRFWDSMTIEEVAADLRIDWEEADQLITKSLNILREKLIVKQKYTTGAA